MIKFKTTLSFGFNLERKPQAKKAVNSMSMSVCVVFYSQSTLMEYGMPFRRWVLPVYLKYSPLPS